MTSEGPASGITNVRPASDSHDSGWDSCARCDKLITKALKWIYQFGILGDSFHPPGTREAVALHTRSDLNPERPRAHAGRKFGAVLQSDLGDSRAALNWGKALCLRAQLLTNEALLPADDAPDPQVCWTRA